MYYYCMSNVQKCVQLLDFGLVKAISLRKLLLLDMYGADSQLIFGPTSVSAIVNLHVDKQAS